MTHQRIIEAPPGVFGSQVEAVAPVGVPNHCRQAGRQNRQAGSDSVVRFAVGEWIWYACTGYLEPGTAAGTKRPAQTILCLDLPAVAGTA